MTHDYLDLELCAATAHHDLIAGAAVTAHPADFAELRLTSDADVGVVSQGDRQRSRLGADPVAAGRDRAFDRGLPSLCQSRCDRRRGGHGTRSVFKLPAVTSTSTITSGLT